MWGKGVVVEWGQVKENRNERRYKRYRLNDELRGRKREGEARDPKKVRVMKK